MKNHAWMLATLILLSLVFLACESGNPDGDVADGDEPDGDTSDGDDPADGDAPPDGDEPVDGDDLPDGDDPTDGDNPDGEIEDNPDTDISINKRLSGCYDADSSRMAKRGKAGQCPDEMLAWTYDSGRKMIRLDNRYVHLNCCGIHDVRARYVGDVLVFTRVDKLPPPPDNYRCKCLCLFDFKGSVRVLGNDFQPLRLELLVSDLNDGQPMPTWEGVIDLSLSSGEVVTRENTRLCY